MAKDIECCLLVLQLCNSFMAKTCLMLAVITLYYFPNLGPFSFVFVVNFGQVLSLWVGLQIL